VCYLILPGTHPLIHVWRVVARSTYWMKHLLELIGHSGNMAIVTHIIGTEADGTLVSAL
jgi:hypothetical protein